MFVKVTYKSFTLANRFGPVDLLQKFNSQFYLKHIGDTTKVIDYRYITCIENFPHIKTLEQALQAHPEYFI
jgi:hypothetical protein